MKCAGGGYIDDEIGPGLYMIKAFGNPSMFVITDAAADTYEYRAKQLCPQGYEEIGLWQMLIKVLALHPPFLLAVRPA